MLWKKALAVSLAILFCYNLLLAITDTSAEQGQTVLRAVAFDQQKTERLAPVFELEELFTGELIGNETASSPLLLNFWASWCEPCQLEAPHLVQLQALYQDQLNIYAINLTDRDSLSGAIRFTEEYQLPFPVLLDRDGSVADQFGVLSIPTSVFIDEHGRIMATHYGYADLEAFVLYVEDLLRRTKS